MKTLRLLVACLLVLGLPPVLILWHHSIVGGLHPALNGLIALVFLLLAIPPVTWIFKTLKSPAIGHFPIRPDTWFALGAVVLLVLSFDPGRVWRHSSVDFHRGDTYYVISMGSIVFALAVWFGLVALVYFFFPKFTGRPLRNGLGYIHFWVTVLVVDFVLFPTRYILPDPMPRRYIDWSGFHRFESFNWTFVAVDVVGLLAQLLLPVNMLYTLLKKGRPLSGAAET